MTQPQGCWHRLLYRTGEGIVYGGAFVIGAAVVLGMFFAGGYVAMLIAHTYGWVP